jgi:hypothetical protein
MKSFHGGGGGRGKSPSSRALTHLPPRLRYAPVRVSILIVSPSSMNSGTEITAPVSNVAGLDPPWTVFPFTLGGHSVTVRSTKEGGSTDTTFPSKNWREQMEPSFKKRAQSSSRGTRVSSYDSWSMKTYCEGFGGVLGGYFCEFFCEFFFVQQLPRNTKRDDTPAYPLSLTSSPSAYVNCASRLVTVASGTFSAARNVRSCVAPVRQFLIFVRTKAAPFPGLTCMNSVTRKGTPSMRMVVPFLKSLEEMRATWRVGRVVTPVVEGRCFCFVCFSGKGEGGREGGRERVSGRRR